MDPSNTTHEAMGAMTDSPTPAPTHSAARSAIFHFFDFISSAIVWISTIAIWAATLFVTASLGGGALLLARFCLGYKDECEENKKWYNGDPPSVFWAGLFPTGGFQVAFLIYLANVAEEFSSWKILGLSIIGVVVVLVYTLAFMGVVVGIIQAVRAVCRKGGRESVDQEAETESAGEKV